jgi:hypothetical protein
MNEPINLVIFGCTLIISIPLWLIIIALAVIAENLKKQE